MWICECSKLWKARLGSCPACGGSLRAFGTAPIDSWHPMAGRVPIGKRSPASPASPPQLAGGDGDSGNPDPVPVVGRPGSRSPVGDWRDWAVAVGFDPDRVGQMTKPELRALPETPMAVVG